jgi:hypothetical protein
MYVTHRPHLHHHVNNDLFLFSEMWWKQICFKFRSDIMTESNGLLNHFKLAITSDEFFE